MKQTLYAAHKGTIPILVCERHKALVRDPTGPIETADSANCIYCLP